MNLKSLNSLTPQLTKYLKVVRYGNRLRPQRDWVYLIGISFILLVASASWSYWVFNQISEGTQEVAPSTTGTAIAPASLDTVRSIFERRALERAHYLSDYHFVDPSH